MYIQAEQGQLLKNLYIVEKAVPHKTSVQLIQGILLEACDNQLVFKSTNLEMSVEASCNEIQLDEEGSVVLAKKFTDIIKQLPDRNVEITVDSENFRTVITSGKSNFTLYGMDPAEFPQFTEENTWRRWNQLQFKADEFSDMLRKLIFAVSQDESKPPFRGVLFEFDGENMLQCTASDTYRLARVFKKIELEQPVEPFRLLVPGKNLSEIMRALDGNEEEAVDCFFSNSEIVITYGSFHFYSRLLEDRYPNLGNVFPGSFQTRIKVHNDLLEKTIHRASLLAQGYNQMISLHVEGDTLRVKSGSEIGRMDEELHLEQKEGQDLPEILLNARFLLDSLRILNGEYLYVELNGHHGPCVIQDELDNDMDRYRYLVLPIKSEGKGE